MLEELIHELRARSVLVLGIGGSGDVVSALHVFNRLRLLGVSRSLGTVPWERFTVDPTPGPVDVGELRNATLLGRSAALVWPWTYACRRGYCFRLQASGASRAAGVPVVAVSITGAVEGFVRGVEEFARIHGLDLIIGVDAGGDVLAEGWEPELWSPLADQVVLAGMVEVKWRLGVEAVLAVHGLGCDGELGLERLMERVSLVASKGGLLGFEGLSKWDEELMEEALKQTTTEASRLPFEGFKGFRGEREIRLGSRRAAVNALSAATVILDAVAVFRESPMALSLVGTKDIWEACKRLNDMGIYTELNLEADLSVMRVRDPLLVRSRGLERIAGRAERARLKSRARA